MSESEKNLKEAFAGESQANRKYSAFAKKAEAEGVQGSSHALSRSRCCRNDSCS
jgi:rubrerythrin